METIQDNSVRFKFAIKNFTEDYGTFGKRVDSKNVVNFGANGSKSKWCLSLYPKGRRNEDKGFMSLYLCLNYMECKKIDVKYKFSIQSVEDQESFAVQRITNYRKITGCGMGQFIDRKQLFDDKKLLIPNDVLTLVCEFIILDNGIDEDTIHQKHENLKQKYQKASQELLSLKSKYEINEDSINPENELLNDIKYLFVSEQHADVIFRVEEEHLLYAHRAILSARSPVFNSMFSTDVLKSAKITVDLPDIEFKVMLEILRYIYTGLVEDLDNIAAELFDVAEKYELSGLKQLCEKSMGETMNVDTALSTFVFADSKALPELKQIGKSFIRKNLKFLMNKDEWITFVTKYPTLLYDVLSKL